MSHHILIADDDRDFTSVLRELLEGFGYKVTCAHDGVVAYELAQKIKPNLIILDWKMPSGKGSAVLEMLREKQLTKEVPVIILSGASEPGMDAWAKSLGVKARFQKPYEAQKLLGAVKNILDPAN